MIPHFFLVKSTFCPWLDPFFFITIRLLLQSTVFHAGNPHGFPTFCMVSVLGSTKVESYLATELTMGDRGPVFVFLMSAT